MADRVVVTKSLTAASANAIALSQTPAAAGSLTLNGASAVGGLATLDTQRRVLITSGGNDAGITFTVKGTNGAGAAISQTVPGANAGTVATDLDFLTVSSIANSGAVAAGGVTVGTNAVGSTAWQIPNPHITPFEIGFAGEILSGAATYSVELTDDTLLAPMPIYSVAALPIPSLYTVSGMAGQMGSSQGAVDGHAPAGWRLTILAGTGNSQVTATQSGIRN